LSIIIPISYEASPVGKLLEALSRQTFRDFEVILVARDIQDPIKEIVTFYQERLPSLRLLVEEQGRLAQARNTGARAAHGDTLIFMEDDRTVEDTFLARMAGEMRKRGLTVASPLSLPVSPRWGGRLLYRMVLGFGLRILQFFFPIVTGACIAVTREIFDAVGGFDETIHFEDNAFVKQAAKKGRFRILKESAVAVSVRRLGLQGRLRTFWQWIVYGFFRRLLLGEKPIKEGVSTGERSQ
jgi:hypothetical protein